MKDITRLERIQLLPKAREIGEIEEWPALALLIKKQEARIRRLAVAARLVKIRSLSSAGRDQAS